MYFLQLPLYVTAGPLMSHVAKFQKILSLCHIEGWDEP